MKISKFDPIVGKIPTNVRKRADASVDISALALAEPSALRQAESGLQQLDENRLTCLNGCALIRERTVEEVGDDTCHTRRLEHIKSHQVNNWRHF